MGTEVRLERHTPATSSLTAVYVDFNIITRSLPTLAVSRQIIGYNDEVIDTAFLTSSAPSTSSPDGPTPAAESHLAVATNSDLIRVYDLARFHTSLLAGHSDVVLCLASSSDRQLLVSGSKDKTARVWAPRSATSPDWTCVATATGHVESIGALAVSRRERSFLISASQDRTAKIWDLAAVTGSSDDERPTALRSLATMKIHDKDINSLDVAPNDKLLASGSQDRTARLFRIVYVPASKSSPATAALEPLGTFKGHKRGVWSVKFSPVDQILATASGDRTVKLWSLGDFSCLKVRRLAGCDAVEGVADPVDLGRRSRAIRTRSFASTFSRAGCSSSRARRTGSSRSGTSRTKRSPQRWITTRRRCDLQLHTCAAGRV